MPITKKTFEQRLSEIANFDGTLPGTPARPKQRQRSLATLVLTFPFVLGVGILLGGTAYAWAAASSDLTWVLAFAG
ncbi:MAG: hypothetical protein P8N14_04405 [Sulfitobacter sp.]|nr:hypothetical protein [Sulfitobacter sp.]